MTDPVTVPLSKPIEHDDKTIASLTLKEMTVADLCASDLVDGPTKKSAALLASITGVPLPLILKLPIADYSRAMEAIDRMGSLQRRVDRRGRTDRKHTTYTGRPD